MQGDEIRATGEAGGVKFSVGDARIEMHEGSGFRLEVLGANIVRGRVSGQVEASAMAAAPMKLPSPMQTEGRWRP